MSETKPPTADEKPEAKSVAETEGRKVVGYRMHCTICQATFVVRGIGPFVEVITNRKMLAYFPADMPETPEHGHIKNAVGVSQGTGNTFECVKCHAVKWAAETGQPDSTTVKEETKH